MIGDNVEITVVDIRGDKVRLGITAPREIQVHRKEVYEAIKRENQQAAQLSPKDVADVARPSGLDQPPASRPEAAELQKRAAVSRTPAPNGKERNTDERNAAGEAT
jgi:carbon storage regulator